MRLWFTFKNIQNHSSIIIVFALTEEKYFFRILLSSKQGLLKIHFFVSNAFYNIKFADRLRALELPILILSPKWNYCQRWLIVFVFL